MNQASSRMTFFRQSGWMVFATLAGGALMYAVHMAAGKMPKAEYGVFATMLQLLTLMTIPAIGLQTLVMRQTVAAQTEALQRQLGRAIRTLLLGTLVVWVILMAGAFIWLKDLMDAFKAANPATIWLTATWGLGILWLPIFVGILQGRQDFAWMGGISILGGLTRFVAMLVIVVWLGGLAAGACLGVLVQVVVAATISGWRTRLVWLAPGEKVVWGDWGTRVVPLTLGAGVISYMMSLDMIVVQYFFPDVLTGYYAAAGMIGRALVFLTAPMVQVMFPKVVASVGRSEKSNAALLAIGATALIGGGAAFFCTILPSLPLRIVYDASYLRIAWLVPWFAWCVLPLTLGSVLVNNLLAKERYRIVIGLMIVALAYAGALVVVCRANSSLLLSSASFPAVTRLAGKLGNGSDGISRFLQARLSAETRQLLLAPGGLATDSSLADKLADDLNRIIAGECIYAQGPFAAAPLSQSLRDVASRKPQGKAAAAVNRLLLEEIYPDEISPMTRRFLPVVQTLGGFGLLLVGVCLWFTLRGGNRGKPTEGADALPLPE